jgi:5-methylcytosine-specific restriction protein A
MPRVLRPCKNGGCPYLVNEGAVFCRSCIERGVIHPVSDYRAQHNAMYDSPEWRRYSKDYRDAHPLCADPYHRHVGETRAVHAVDHITPHCGNRSLFWNPKNHQPLCEACHNWKSTQDKAGRNAASVPARVSHASIDPAIGGIITDPRLVGRLTRGQKILWKRA